MSNAREAVQSRLFALQDKDYQTFLARLLPTLDSSTIIGIRTPALRKLAKELSRQPETAEFLNDLPHTYFEENNLHAFLIDNIKDYNQAITAINDFLPYIDNWATCDQSGPKVFQKHRAELREEIIQWLASEQTYTVRYGIGMLMRHYLDDAFQPEYLEWVAGLSSKEYYVNMMVAWYFATALAKKYDATLPYLEENRLALWTHNKTIQKTVESNRITSEQKTYLKTLRRKQG